MNLITIISPVRYDTVKAGIQHEVYKELIPVWWARVRLFNPEDDILLVRGPRRPAMAFKVAGIRVGTGRPDWGAEPIVRYYIFALGVRLK